MFIKKGRINNVAKQHNSCSQRRKKKFPYQEKELLKSSTYNTKIIHAL